MDYFKSVKKNMKILYKSDNEIEQCSSFSDKINCDSLRLDSYTNYDTKDFKIIFDKYQLQITDIIYIPDDEIGTLSDGTRDEPANLIEYLIDNMGNIQFYYIVFIIKHQTHQFIAVQ
jgi:hypothetical protein